MRILLTLLIIFILGSQIGTAQNSDKQKSIAITANSKNEVIDTLLKRLNELYVFPDVAFKIEKAIRQNQKKRIYENIQDAKSFANTLTRQLLTISNDKHLGVNYSYDSIPIESGVNEPSPEQLKRMQRFAISVNFGFNKIDILEGNIGYMRIDGFIPADAGAETAIAAMNYLTNTDALIIDLRQNQGGDPSMINFLSTYFFNKPTHLNDLFWRTENRTKENWTLPYVPGKYYTGKPVFILTSENTISAGEEFAYNLQSLKRATIVGETTAGAANPGWEVRINEHFNVFIPNGRAINPITKTNWEGTGVKPDIQAPQEQALPTAHIAALKKLLETNIDEALKEQLKDIIKKLEK